MFSIISPSNSQPLLANARPPSPSLPIVPSSEHYFCGATLGAAGKLMYLQLATDKVHALIDVVDPRIIQDRNPKSHYQNAQTCGRLLEKLKEHLKKVRCDFGLPEDEPSMLIFDAAPQHSNPDILEAAHIRVERSPKKITCFDKAKKIQKIL